MPLLPPVPASRRMAAALCLAALHWSGCGLSPAANPTPSAGGEDAHTPVAPPLAGPASNTPTTGTQPAQPRGPRAASSGCAVRSAVAGESTIAAGGFKTSYLLTLPDHFDPSQPVPLVFAFHGRTRSHTSMHQSDASGLAEAVGKQALVAYVKSVGIGWDARSVPPVDALYDYILSNYCVDVEQVFAVGHSSGAHFAHRLACTRASKLRGIAAVAGGIERAQCTGSTATLLIHGKRDAVVSVSRGHHALQRVRQLNGCSSETAAFGLPDCVRYQGCAPDKPVAWCEHNEPTYENTNHGWPSTASAAIAQFFAELPPRPLPTGPNRLAAVEDPAFANAWPLQTGSGASATNSARPGALCTTIQAAGENPWDVQLGHGGLQLQGGQSYQIDLTVRASAPTKVRVRLGLDAPPWGEMWVQTLDAGPQPVRVRDEFLLVEQPAGSLSFGVQMGGALAHSPPVTVCLEHAHLSEVHPSAAAAP